MAWTFEQSTGKLYDPQGNRVASGYAGGNCGKNPEGKNNADMQDQPKIGPLPEGLYTHGEVVLQSHLGPFAIPLIPDPSNEMFNRSGFFMHGDSVENPGSASEGCVIMPRAVREAYYNSDDNQIQVVKEKQ